MEQQNQDQNQSKGQTKRSGTWWGISAIVVFILTKFKTALLLLSKIAGPMIGLIASAVLYAWINRSWLIGIGFVLMILIHEIGHIVAARMKGVPSSLPFFIPFLGALIMLKRNPRDAATEAFVAYGGPLFGTVGAIFALAYGIHTQSIEWLIIAYLGFFINAINLLPIHPLDGGRISVAVTRWLWLVGLFGGLFVIWWLKSILFFIIWALFAFEMFQKYVRNRKGKPIRFSVQLAIPVSRFAEYGEFLPGEHHRRELNFTTHSSLEGKQTIVLFWERLGIAEQMEFNTPITVNSVAATRFEYKPQGGPAEQVIAYIEVTGEKHENDRYYEVPASVRWRYGIAYIALAAFLIYMIMYTGSVHLDEVNV